MPNAQVEPHDRVASEGFMLIALRIFRVIVGLVGIWQAVGLLPILTNWLPHLQSTTENMWAIAFVKFLMLTICAVLYYWLGKVKSRYESARSPTSELPSIGIALAVISVVGIAAAIVLPALSPPPSNAVLNPQPQRQATQERQTVPPPPLGFAVDAPARSASATAPTTLKFQCSGIYTQRENSASQEFPIKGAALQIDGDQVSISGAAVFDGTFTIITRLESGIGFQNPNDETLGGFFNRFGDLSLIDRLGPENPDGSFQVSATSALVCQNAKPMF